MCNSKSNTTTTLLPTITVTDKPAQNKRQQNHFYFNFLSHPNTIKNPEQKPNKHNQESSSPHDSNPSISEIITESKSLFNLAFPMVLTGLILYARSILSMLFLGHLGDLELAAGSLAIAFGNITGYSVLSGLALGMEPLCSQAFGAKRFKFLSLTLHRSVIFLLICSIPISLLWLNMSKILLLLHQDPNITIIAHTYLMFSLPDLITNSFIHPIRIYLRSQGITQPLTLSTLFGTILHLPINFFLVTHLRLGVTGVAIAASVTNLFVLITLVLYIWFYDIHEPTWSNPTRECLTGWKPLLKLSGPSCVSVCLEWWWYEIMTISCGLLIDPKSTVASMGILIQATSLIYIFPSSLSFAVSTRVGNEIGANRPKRAKLSAAVAVFLAAVMGLSATVFATGMRDRWGTMFTDDVGIIRLTSAALPILGLCELGNCPQTVGCGVLRGTARPSTAANVNLGAFYLVGMPIAIGLGFWLGVGFCGLWLGLLAAQICCAGLMLYVVSSTDWNLQAERSDMLTCAGCTDTDNSEEQEPLIRITVTSA